MSRLVTGFGLENIDQQDAMTRGLRTVVAVANELMTGPDVDTTLRQAVEAARHRLGLERCAIFLERDGFMQGTYGTDYQGQTTAEHGNRVALDTVWSHRLELLKPEDAQWIVVQDRHSEWRDGQRQELPDNFGWIVFTRILFPDGSRGFLVNDAAISGAPLDEVKQEVVAVFCSLLGNILARKQDEDNIRRALETEVELNQMKSRFISNISHEFRTPMTIIQTSTEMLSRYGQRMDDGKKQYHLDKIVSQIHQMTLLLENVLTINQAKAGLDFNPGPVAVLPICAACIEAVIPASDTEQRVIFSHDGACATSLLDEKLLRQIMTNLLTNAVKYSLPGGEIRFNLTCAPQQLTFSIQDAGIGIPLEDQKYLFQEFYRA
ncbi:MAG TPA: HAMP domain-containing sensor histidine kinase, partial [Phototrophicaceae bacterium]|nr:HAMP domain-containing sensor histidine kinase [Phototrophicaceae bacterium]